MVFQLTLFWERTTVTNTPLCISGQFTVTLDPSSGNHFYILASKCPDT